MGERFRKIALVFFIASHGLVFSPRSPSQSASSQPGKSGVAAVIGALQAGQNDDALRMVDTMLRTDPQNYKLLTLRAVAFEKSGKPQEALPAYRHALKIAPDYMPALEGAAQLLYKGRDPQAVPVLRRILTISPENAVAHAMLAIFEYRQNNFSAAAKDFSAAEPVLGSQPDALMAYSICLAHLGQTAGALTRIEQLVRLDPQNHAARFDLALLQWRANKDEEALSTLQPLVDERFANALRLAAAIHEARSETPQAIELLRTAIAADPHEEGSYLDFASLAATHGSFAVGVDFVTLGIEKIPNSAVLYMTRGVLNAQNGDLDRAMSDFEHAHRLDPSNSMAGTAQGIAQSQGHNHAAAVTDFRQQVREHPKDAFAHYLLAEALSWAPTDAPSGDHRESFDQAIAEAARAVALDPHLVKGYDLLGSLYFQNEQTELAVKTCRSALAIDPKDQQAIYTLMLALRKTGSKQEVKALVQQLTDLRKAENAENNQKSRYGQLIEAR